MMRYHAAQFTDPAEQVEQARALLSFLASASADTGAYHQLLTAEAERLSRSPDSYLFHEHLERTNLPRLLPPVHRTSGARRPPVPLRSRRQRDAHVALPCAGRNDARAHQSGSAAPRAVHGLRPEPSVPSDAAVPCDASPRADHEPGRAARTCWCRRPRRPRPASPDLTPGVPVTFTSGTRRAEVSSPASKAALTALMERWPGAIDVDALLDIALERSSSSLPPGSNDDRKRATLEDLFGAVMYGLIELHTSPPSCTNSPSETPRAHPVAAFQATRGPIVVNAHHTMHELDALALQVLQLSNGRTSRARWSRRWVDGSRRAARHSTPPSPP